MARPDDDYNKSIVTADVNRPGADVHAVAFARAALGIHWPRATAIDALFVDMKPRPCANPAYPGKTFGSNAAAWWGYQ
jgi:hypothetical protein